MTLAPLLAHAGAGASWQAVVVLACAGLAVVVVLAAMGRLPIREGADLLLPLAAVSILSSVAPSASDVLSDAIGWALPIGIVALGALLLAATTDLELTPRSPLTMGAAVLAATAAVTLAAPLTDALHPPEDAGTAVDTDGGGATDR